MPRRSRFPHHPFPRKALRLRRHFKWILWLALSTYLFLTTTTNSFFRPAQAPIAVQTPSTPPPLTLPKVFVYELPPRYNTDWLSNPRCGNHLFASEVAIHEALLSYPGRAVHPAEADFFFVPVYVCCNFSTPNGFPALHHVRPLLVSAVDFLSSRFPFWNRSRGSDHVFVASHDFGACFHAMEDVAIADGIPEFMKRSIILQTFGVRSPHVCQEAEHMLIPPYVPPSIQEEWPVPEKLLRDIFVFFRGKMEVHPKNVSGHFYGKRVRTEIWRRYCRNPRFRLERKRSGDYRAEMARSVFCLCPAGVGAVEPAAGGGGGARVRARLCSGRDPTTISGGATMAGDFSGGG